ncbi:MAG: glycerophosphodiester phosphodiesterase [Rhizobiales bacterium]|nr:glycerophosphodiester phosphodiesterase [Hyphomicrobiales bacterium]MBI3672842.1 glycerophosphodiester phosphodiesterase [Hyphomicrobiales bacterium]
MRALDWLVARPIAHRGLHDRARGIIENTASAFDGAMAGGYAIECDLQITCDSEAMVFHDDTLDRLTAERGSLKGRTSADLKAIPISNSSDRMQTLAELLAQVGGAVPLVIEIKSHWDGEDALIRRALKVLESYRGPYGLMSFDPDVIAAVRRYSPDTVRGIVADRTIDPDDHGLSLARRLELRTLSHLPRTAPHFISFYFRDLPFTPVTEYRRTGCPVISWTIRSPAEAELARRYSDQVTFEGFAA